VLTEKNEYLESNAPRKDKNNKKMFLLEINLFKKSSVSIG